MKKLAVLLIITTAFLSACSSSKWVRDTVAKHNDYIVTLEKQEVKGEAVSRQYDHPYEIDLADLKALMKDLTYTEKVGLIGKEKKSPVFQAVEIELLAPVLADALAKADASQRIHFTSFNQGKALIFSVSRETEGVMFIKPEKQLNIAFHFINSEIDPTQTTAYPPQFSLVDPLEIKTAYTTIVPTPPYADTYTFDNGKQSPMWVVADLEKFAAQDRSVPAKDADVQKQSLPAAAPVTGIPAAETETAAPPAPDSGDLLQQDIKNKLKYLKELLDEGLISEKDYNAKKTELLDKLD